jgi:hypothetical protein
VKKGTANRVVRRNKVKEPNHVSGGPSVRLVLAAALVVIAGAITMYAQTERRTVWTGAYTSAQAMRGEAAYMTHCFSCHKGNEETVNQESRLKGIQFMERWREDNVESLFGLIRSAMPQRDPGSLSDNTYIDIVAFLLQENGFPAGDAELTVSGSPEIQIEGKDGPRPLPHGALVQSVGCLIQGEDSWLLTQASEPARTRTPNEMTPKESASASQTALGREYFRLRNLQFLSETFRPLDHSGSKIHVKGFLIRQPNRERIDVTSVDVVASDCSPNGR